MWKTCAAAPGNSLATATKAVHKGPDRPNKKSSSIKALHVLRHPGKNGGLSRGDRESDLLGLAKENATTLDGCS